MRPLDPRGETPADRGLSHISRNLKFLGIDAPGALQGSWTVPAFTAAPRPRRLDLRLAAFAEPLAVACHDVRRGEVAAGELVVVIGGGPIGLLIALVARARGARVLLRAGRDPADARGRARASSPWSPAGRSPPPSLERRREPAPTSSSRSPDRGRHPRGNAARRDPRARRRRRDLPEPRPVALFDLFWKELEVRGARVYEQEDFEAAIDLLATARWTSSALITAVEPLERVPEVFEELLAGRPAMKMLVDCRA